MSGSDALSAQDGTTARATMLVIAGMHRSGTSALARSCNLLGVDLGSEFIQTQPDNASGFWEDAGVKDADDLALASHGLLWDDVRPLPDPWIDGFGGSEVRVRLRRTLAALSCRSRLCGVKDPRISRLLPLWLPLLDELQLTPVFLIALRDPDEVATSLARRDRVSAARAQLLWLRHSLEAELHTRGHRRWFVDFDDLLRDWRGTLARAAREVGIVWPVPLADAAATIDTFLDPSQRHHVAARDAAPVAAGEPARWARAAYATLRALRDDDTPSRRGELDTIRCALGGADVALGPLVAELEREIASLRDGADDAADKDGRSVHQRELDRARREAILAHELVGQRDLELHTAASFLQDEREVFERTIAAANAELAARRTEAEDLRRALDALRGELAAQREQTASALQVIADVESSLSWRVTTPLRGLNAALRGGRRGR